MKQNIPHTARPTRQAMPLALTYTSRLLLTEKSSATAEVFSLSLKMETRTIHANMATRIFKKIPDYSHYGLND